MPVTTDFHKDTAEEYLNALLSGIRIRAPRYIHELLTLGGVIYYIAREWDFGDWPRDDPRKLPKEVGEAKEEIRGKEVAEAFRRYGRFIAQVHGGTYDRKFLPRLEIHVAMDGEEAKARIVKGRRRSKGP